MNFHADKTFLSTLINAQILRDGLAHSLKMEAIFPAGRSVKAGHTSQPTISTSMKRTSIPVLCLL